MSAPNYHFEPRLLERIEAPADGILSVPLFQDATTKVVLFAFAAGQELSEHTASVPATIQLLQGRATWTLGSDSVEASAGSWAQMQANLPHSIHALEPCVMLLTLNRAFRAPSEP